MQLLNIFRRSVAVFLLACGMFAASPAVVGGAIVSPAAAQTGLQGLDDLGRASERLGEGLINLIIRVGRILLIAIAIGLVVWAGVTGRWDFARIGGAIVAIAVALFMRSIITGIEGLAS